MRIVCVSREPLYSPGKVEADRAILEAVVDHLGRKHEVRTIDPGSGLAESADASAALVMCQGPEALRTLRSWQASGLRVVNTPDAIEACHRRRMIPAFERARIAHPESRLIETQSRPEAPAWLSAGAWLKRGDVHATRPQDVVAVSTADGLASAVASFHRRGIGSAVVQRHIEGQVIKFYAVPGRFFRCYWPDGSPCDLGDRERRELIALAEGAAAALGLEIFGGDCVREPNGRLWLIDMNDWPSYAPCRSTAAEAIADYFNAEIRSS
jgi:glutathione synthase/RimK-type ligase-like ATP-grasp enzyme